MNDNELSWLGLDPGAPLEHLGHVEDRQARALARSPGQEDAYPRWLENEIRAHREVASRFEARGWVVELIVGRRSPIAVRVSRAGRRICAFGREEHAPIGLEAPDGSLFIDPRREGASIVLSADGEGLRLSRRSPTRFDVEHTRYELPHPFSAWMRGVDGQPWLNGVVARCLRLQRALEASDCLAAGLIIRHAEISEPALAALDLGRLLRGERDPVRTWAGGQPFERHVEALRWAEAEARRLRELLELNGTRWGEEIDEGDAPPELLELMLARDDVWCIRAVIHEGAADHHLADQLDAAVRPLDALGSRCVEGRAFTVGGHIERLVHARLVEPRLWWGALRTE